MLIGSSNHHPIVLACASNDAYAMPLAATVRSVLENLGGNLPVHLFILDGGIRAAKKRRIISSLNSYPVEIFWIQPSAKLLSNLPLSAQYPLAIYYRLLLPKIIPSTCKKAIYLDTDLIVVGDLEQLWQIDIQDHAILAVQDACQRYIHRAGGFSHAQKLEIPPESKYFNSGVLVINLDYWRTEKILERAIAYLQKNAQRSFNPDQDALNALMVGKWGELDPRWNQIHAIHGYASWQDSPYSQEVFDQVLHQPYIVHYTTPPKPWQTGCRHPRQDLFYEYLDKTAWAGWRETLWRRAWRRLEKEIQMSDNPQQNSLAFHTKKCSV
jgi:lipopolysaccharide biosynthesis glycosyltransferase